MAELVFFSGTMDCGKSTLALQMDYNHSARGRGGILFSRNDRAGESMISSRLGLQTPAVEVRDSTDFWAEVLQCRDSGHNVDYLICDEAQFYSAEQVEQLAYIVDEMDIDVFAFGITSDFRTRLFPGSQRLVELADRMEVLQVRALCWCGRRATHNARTADGVMVTEGDQVVVGDVESRTAAAPAAGAPLDEPLFEDEPLFDDMPLFDAEELLGSPQGAAASAAGGGEHAAPAAEPAVGYETLCRRHYMRRVTAQQAAATESGDTPADVCSVELKTGRHRLA
ncbi:MULTISPECIES: thymidine kinase [unclassified Arthrobacter]|uniref:thymidine kinase n=1 Tax=unclassified Arthrobacter TaxID=235627 RepID=UPI001D13F3C6|nr:MULTISPECIES: thymidine kinase [unclassified Arthrobacter]MCC3274403.1 thymidine kinase [Arthrobacter sp. zg-Y20]MCC9178003.1 thymidine kinase [Arthrobacter sp. zg-Y750]MDK1314559.1 thymidine kinase [Arthrobacter sp. zg.Y20]MDK1327447.1 thymidine kinase [Arthrobacter sp. zg-Y1143]WIB07542.1 thymidine kinase [Arthrobacter sp. zg-Y20]